MSKIQSVEQLQNIIDYIIWNFDVNNDNVLDKAPSSRIQEFENYFRVEITYTCCVHKGPHFSDPTIGEDDFYEDSQSEFKLLKSEGYKQLTKYVEDICNDICKVKL